MAKPTAANGVNWNVKPKNNMKKDYQDLKDKAAQLPEEQKINLMVSLYYSMTCAGKDKFLHETENG